MVKGTRKIPKNKLRVIRPLLVLVIVVDCLGKPSSSLQLLLKHRCYHRRKEVEFRIGFFGEFSLKSAGWLLSYWRLSPLLLLIGVVVVVVIEIVVSRTERLYEPSAINSFRVWSKGLARVAPALLVLLLDTQGPLSVAIPALFVTYVTQAGSPSTLAVSFQLSYPARLLAKNVGHSGARSSVTDRVQELVTGLTRNLALASGEQTILLCVPVYKCTSTLGELRWRVESSLAIGFRISENKF